MKEQSEFYITEYGNKIWYLPNKEKNYWHRENGPAYESAHGSKWWYVNGKCHRLDGPAVEYADENKEWWVDGKELNIKEVETWLEENNVDLSESEGQMAFKLRWS